MLTPEQIDLAIQQHVDPVATYGRLHNFARAIEAEVRKQDEALIRWMLEAMEGVKALNMGGELALWTAEFDRLLSAITAGCVRLEGNKCERCGWAETTRSYCVPTTKGDAQ